MRLQDLEKHILNQTLKINDFIDKQPCFAKFVEVPGNPSWATFRNSVWGSASVLAPLEGGGIDVEAKGDGEDIGVKAKGDGEDIDVEAEGDGETLSNGALIVKLPPTLPDVWRLHSSHLLVRSEYDEAEQAALVANQRNADAFLITGQYGIGSLPLIHHPHPPILILNQEKLSFWFGFSSDVLHSGFPLRCRFVATKHYSFTKAVSPFFKTS
jgi:hypothetical protein